MTLVVLPLTPQRMQDMDAIFEARGCALAKNCYCVYYRVTNREYRQLAGGARPDLVRHTMASLSGGSPAPGLIAYSDNQPVGWVSLGPRADFRRLETSITMRRVDDEPVWSIICFVVPSAHRRQGVAHALLAAAIEFAEQHGATLLEAYPVDRQAQKAPDASWFGSLSMFASAGFEEVGRHKPARPIVRLKLPKRR